MTTRRRALPPPIDQDAARPLDAPKRDVQASDSALQRHISERLAAPRSLKEAEEQYAVVRDAWVAAMRAANSGRSADLASLAIAQEAYEAAVEERELWLSGARVAIDVEPEHDGHSPRELDAAIDNELAWRVVHDAPKPTGFFSRFRRKRRED